MILWQKKKSTRESLSLDGRKAGGEEACNVLQAQGPASNHLGVTGSEPSLLSSGEALLRM